METTTHYNDTDIQKELEHGIRVMMLSALTGFLLVFTFLVHFWVGESWANFGSYETKDLFYALVAFLIAATQAYAEYRLYQYSRKLSALMIVARVVLMTAIITFEVGNTMHREDARVHEQSENSPVFLATVKSIESASIAAAIAGATASPAAVKAAGNMAACKTDKCKNIYQAQIDADKDARAGNQAAAASQINALIGNAKSLEYDDKHFSALTKLFSSLFGTEPLTAALILGILMVGAFQLAFLAVGETVAEYKRELGLVGGSKRRVFAEAVATPVVVIEPTENQRAALNLVWNAIDTGKLTAIAVHDNSPMANLLSEAGHGTTNENRRDLMAFVVDALTREGVLMPNPDYQPGEKNGKKPKHLINPNRVIKYGK